VTLFGGIFAFRKNDDKHLSTHKPKSPPQNSINMNNIMPNLPDHSRVWIYTSSRPFTDFEISETESFGADFVETWRVHGSAIAAELKVIHNQFILIAANEKVATVSGCGIDSSIGFIKGLEERFKVQLLDKLNLGFINKEGNVEVLPMMQFQQKMDTAEITPHTQVFNNMINTLGEVRTSWQVPLIESWHKQLL